jgi:hypothetical protein
MSFTGLHFQLETLAVKNIFMPYLCQVKPSISNVFQRIQNLEKLPLHDKYRPSLQNTDNDSCCKLTKSKTTEISPHYNV